MLSPSLSYGHTPGSTLVHPGRLRFSVPHPTMMPHAGCTISPVSNPNLRSFLKSSNKARKRCFECSSSQQSGGSIGVDRFRSRRTYSPSDIPFLTAELGLRMTGAGVFAPRRGLFRTRFRAIKWKIGHFAAL